MATLTIPKELTRKGELVVIPRQEYEEFLQLQKIVPIVKMTPAQKRDLQKARKDYQEGKYITLQELERELGIIPKK